MLFSNGDWQYAHASGLYGATIGSAIGSTIGAVAGIANGYTLPEKHPEFGNEYPGSGTISDNGLPTGNIGETTGNSPGHVISVANGSAAYGFGGMFDIGSVRDSYGNVDMYLTLGVTIGYGASAGMGYSQTNTNMSMSDFSGWASGVNLSFGKSPVSIEGYMDISHGAVRDHYGGNLTGLGLNLGKGYGWFKYFSYTITFDPPSREIWLHPAMRR
ncbi:MAG: hypothetical protein B7C24_17675 [Bacteroidetes bacterium 4572_77]|nr:MAG: hypothetical protein B7C24_17675 [Bacteroidetes bacterium 4572_77]